jgi:NAD(P)H-hydrate repair Nnr-like enzyme with NAD(P)H-hydrate dehydratase domain
MYSYTISLAKALGGVGDSFGGLVVSMLASGTRVGGFVGFFGSLKNPPHAFLRRGSERICPMSQLCGM